LWLKIGFNKIVLFSFYTKQAGMRPEQHVRNPLLLIFIVVFIDFMGLGVALPIIAPLFVGPNTILFDHATAHPERTDLYGFLLGSFALAQFIGAPLLGAFSDRLGRRKILIFATLINALSFLIFAWGILAKSLLILFASRIIAGMFGSTLPVVQSALADVSTTEDKARNFGIVGIGFGSGFLVGAASSGVLSNPEYVSWFNMATPFFFVAIISLLNFLFILFKLPETLKVKNPHNMQFFSSIQNIQKAYNHKKLRFIFLMIFVLTFGFAFFLQFIQVFLIKKFDYNEMQLGLFIAYFAVWVAISQGVFLRFVSHFANPAKVLLYSIPLFAFSFYALSFPAHHKWLYALLPLLTIFQGLTFPNLLAMLSNNSADDVQGEVIGINQSIQSLATAIPPLAGGFLMTLSPKAPMLLGCYCALIGWMIYLVYYFRNQVSVSSINEAELESSGN
jgi:DHA1 family tetracycline resistance protein-like MFS transporter